jgi:hypothetical protein
MALGTNTLGLLFKIGVDPGEAQTAFKQMAATWTEAQRQIAKAAINEGVIQFNTLLKSSKTATDEEKDAVLELRDALARTGKEIDAASDAFRRQQVAARAAATQFNDVKNSLQQISQGNFVSVIDDIGRAMIRAGATGNVVILALVALAAAIYAASKAIDEFQDTVKAAGTESRDAFNELEASLARVGVQLTLVDHALAQEVQKSFKDLQTVVTAFFLQILRESGPELLILIKEVTRLLVVMLPIAAQIGKALSEGFVQGLSALRALEVWIATHDLALAFRTWGVSVTELRKEADALGKSFEGQTGTFKEHTRAVKAHTEAIKDLTAAQLEAHEEERALALTRQEAALANKEIAADEKRGLLTFEEAQERRIAVFKAVADAERAALDAAEKRVRADTTVGPRAQQDALEKIEASRASLRLKIAEAEEDERRATADHFEKLKLEWLSYAEFIHKQTDKIVQDIARQAQPPPVAIPEQVPGIAPEIPLPKPMGGFFDDLMKNLKDSGVAFTTWADFAGKAISGVAGATEDLLRTFILTGKGGGAAFKAWAAGIIASLAVEAAVRAIMEVAYGLADLAKAAAAAANPFTAAQAPGFAAAAALHFHSAAVFGLVAGGAAAVGIGIGAAGGLGGGASQAAGGGGFGGTATETTPSPVNISLGGRGATIGISNAVIANAIIDHTQVLGDIRDKLQSMSPGDVVTVAADQKPEAFATGTLEAGRRNGAFTREFMQISGARM